MRGEKSMDKKSSVAMIGGKEKTSLNNVIKESVFRCYKGENMHKTQIPCDTCTVCKCWEKQ